jgi:glycosyltransferase involved in cell wall biosynthesis
VNAANPLITVIIPSYNYERYISQCVESVLNQDYPNIEIIVVDDGSTDGSVTLLEAMNAEIKIVQQSNHGVSSARNHGLLLARGEFVALLDADDYWAPEKLSKQIDLLLMRNVDLVYSGVNLFSSSSSMITGELHPEFRGSCSALFRRYPSRAVIVLGTSNALFRKSVVTQSGLFDPNLSISADWDFLRRFCDYGRVDFLDEPLTYYRQHPENMSAYSSAFARDTVRCVKKMLMDDLSKSSNFSRLSTLLKAYWVVFKYGLKGS